MFIAKETLDIIITCIYGVMLLVFLFGGPSFREKTTDRLDDLIGFLYLLGCFVAPVALALLGLRTSAISGTSTGILLFIIAVSYWGEISDLEKFRSKNVELETKIKSLEGEISMLIQKNLLYEAEDSWPKSAYAAPAMDTGQNTA